MINRNGETYVTIREAIEITGMSRRTIYNWIEKGKVEIIRLTSDRPYIKESTLFKSENEIFPVTKIGQK